jgi:hypothetical protein
LPDVAGLRWLVLLVATGVLCALAAWRLEVFAPPHVAAARRNLRLRGLLDQRPAAERFGDRLPFLKTLARQTSLTRLLAVAGRAQPMNRWVASTVALALGALVFGGVLSAAGVVLTGSAVVPLALGPLLVPCAVLLSYAALHEQARQRQRLMATELGDMVVNLGVLVGPGGVPIEDALLALSRCTRDQAVYSLLRNEGWRQLIPNRPRSQYLLFAEIAEEYDVPEFRLLADAVRSVTVKGLDPLEQYTNLANNVYQARLAEAQTVAAKAKIKLTIPIAGMILPLLLLLTAPLVYAVIAGLRG